MSKNNENDYMFWTVVPDIFVNQFHENFQNIFGFSKYSCFGFRLSRYIFSKLLKFPKALSKRMALIVSTVYQMKTDFCN